MLINSGGVERSYLHLEIYRRSVHEENRWGMLAAGVDLEELKQANHRTVRCSTVSSIYGKYIFNTATWCQAEIS